jgi:hypothetical protein
MRGLLIGLLCGAILFGPMVAVSEAQLRRKVQPVQPVSPEERAVGPVSDAPEGGMSRRERRRLGVTFGKCLRAARELKKAGELSDDSETAAAQIAAKLAADKPGDFAKLSAVDWDAIIAFIEKLIPLILQLIEIFSKFAYAGPVSLQLAA